MSVLFTRRGPAPYTSKPASDYAVGESVFLIEDGVEVEYLVVHQGLPDATNYDASCKGTWLLRKEILETRAWNSIKSSNYNESAIHTYLNADFFALFNEKVQNAALQATIPYTKSDGTEMLGSSGLPTKVFLLSALESGIHPSDSQYLPSDSTALSYFSSLTSDIRIAYLDGVATVWWTRSPYLATTQHAWALDASGVKSQQYTTNVIGIRPALIVSSDTCFNSNTNVIL